MSSLQLLSLRGPDTRPGLQVGDRRGGGDAPGVNLVWQKLHAGSPPCTDGNYFSHLVGAADSLIAELWILWTHKTLCPARIIGNLQKKIHTSHMSVGSQLLFIFFTNISWSFHFSVTNLIRPFLWTRSLSTFPATDTFPCKYLKDVYHQLCNKEYDI